MSLTMLFDVPVRCSITTADGQQLTVDVAALHIDGTMPPSRLELTAPAPPKKEKAKEKKEPKTYSPDEVDDEQIKAALRGDLDTLDLRRVDNRNLLLAVICQMRRRIFKTAVAVYQPPDVMALAQTINQGAKASTFARAMVAAGGDDFWKERKDITVAQLCRNLTTLSGRWEARSTSAKPTLRKMLPHIRQADPLAFGEIEARGVDNMTEDEAKAIVEQWKIKLKKKG